MWMWSLSVPMTSTCLLQNCFTLMSSSTMPCYHNFCYIDIYAQPICHKQILWTKFYCEWQSFCETIFGIELIVRLVGCGEMRCMNVSMTKNCITVESWNTTVCISVSADLNIFSRKRCENSEIVIVETGWKCTGLLLVFFNKSCMKMRGLHFPSTDSGQQWALKSKVSWK